MKTIKLNLGGELKTGDFVGIAYGNSNCFGWYVGTGRDTLQFIPVSMPKYYKEQYDRKAATVTDYSTDRLRKFVSKGFSFEHVRKDYILVYNPNRAFKISNPDEFMAGSTYEQDYLVSKQILIDMHFLKEEP